MSWIDDMNAGTRASLIEAGRIGPDRFAGPTLIRRNPPQFAASELRRRHDDDCLTCDGIRAGGRRAGDPRPTEADLDARPDLFHAECAYRWSYHDNRDPRARPPYGCPDELAARAMGGDR